MIVCALAAVAVLALTGREIARTWFVEAILYPAAGLAFGAIFTDALATIADPEACRARN